MDTPAAVNFVQLTLAVQDVDIVVLVLDHTDDSTRDNLPKLWTQVVENFGEAPVRILLVNKCEENEDRQFFDHLASNEKSIVARDDEEEESVLIGQIKGKQIGVFDNDDDSSRFQEDYDSGTINIAKLKAFAAANDMLIYQTSIYKPETINHAMSEAIKMLT